MDWEWQEQEADLFARREGWLIVRLNVGGLPG